MPSLPSTSNSQGGMIRFEVEHDGRMYTVELPQTATLLDLKKRLQTLTSVQVCRQALTGWRRHPRNDTLPLSGLCLGSETRLRLRDSTADGQLEE